MRGVGAILLSDVWAYPAPDLTHEQKDQLMRRLCTAISAWLEDDLYEDPIEKGARLERAAVMLAAQLADEEPLLQKAPLPRLAVLNSMAPFDAALHDAWGRGPARPALRRIHGGISESGSERQSRR